MHSHRYANRWRRLAADGADLHGEARLIDAMAQRKSRILDAGCGTGRVGGYLAERGHTVVGVDVDPALVDYARQDFPGSTWLAGDLALLDLPAEGIDEPFDLVVAAGNVMAFLAASTRRQVLERIRAHVIASGRFVSGFGAGRGYDFGDFATDAASAGLTLTAAYSSWNLRPFTADSKFLVAVLDPV